MASLMIEMDPTNGGLNVKGTQDVMGNLILAFGMLEAAKMALVDQAKVNERRVQPASVLPPGFPTA